MVSDTSSRQLAVVTGASSGIGRELARLAAEAGYDLVIAADEGPLDEAAGELQARGGRVDAVECDLATAFGVDKLMLAIDGRHVDVLIANAGHGLGQGFLDRPFSEARHVIDTNVTGTLDLIHRVGTEMRRHGGGRILVTSSVAGLVPGASQAVYDASKAFVDSFAIALRGELAGAGVSVTCLAPGATATHFFERAGLPDTPRAVGDKADPAEVAREGWDAMMEGKSRVVPGWRDKVGAAMSKAVPDSLLAEQRRRLAGSARH